MFGGGKGCLGGEGVFEGGRGVWGWMGCLGGEGVFVGGWGNCGRIERCGLMEVCGCFFGGLWVNGEFVWFGVFVEGFGWFVG